MKEVPASRQLVISCITTALLLLMEQKEYHKITIVDITKKAGVSRMAFYRNFNTKEDILLRYCEELLEPFQEKIKTKAYRDIREFLESFLATILDNKSFFDHLIEAQVINIFWEHYITRLQINLEEFLPENITAATGEYVIHFISGGLMNAMKAYFYSGEKMTFEELVTILNGILGKLLPEPTDSSELSF